ncbi:hypothetical protein EVAR_100325_1 [Eumeta japonica]|uniref:Mos1 transposase HTH domain-containing protein n=1 Tax=Eumeta variegata TaxID=151549 RepID=A0A4C1ZSC7_EUMVA|nr:hypothetical protein EVAR_100325_1 [Eumeta japonica]
MAIVTDSVIGSATDSLLFKANSLIGRKLRTHCPILPWIEQILDAVKGHCYRHRPGIGLEAKNSRDMKLRLCFHDEAPSLATVCNWFNEFRRGGTNPTDDLRGDVLLRRRPETTSVMCGSRHRLTRE